MLSSLASVCCQCCRRWCSACSSQPPRALPIAQTVMSAATPLTSSYRQRRCEIMGRMRRRRWICYGGSPAKHCTTYGRRTAPPRIWRIGGTGKTLEHVRELIRALHPVDTGQSWLQDQALSLVTSLLRQRWQLIEHQGPNVRPVVLAILVSWVAVIFASFGLNAPRNATVVVAFLLCSMAIGGSVFLIMEMDNPFQGVLRIPRAPMANALAQMQ